MTSEIKPGLQKNPELDERVPNIKALLKIYIKLDVEILELSKEMFKEMLYQVDNFFNNDLEDIFQRLR